MDLEALRARLRLEAGEFQAGLQSAQQALIGFQERARTVGEGLRNLGESMRRVGAMATAAFTVPIVTGVGKAIMMASDLTEAVSANEQVYGESSKSIQAWSKTTAAAYGITQAESLATTNTLGALYKGLGFTEKQAGSFSMEVVEAAGDLAAFHNADPSEMLDSMRSALVGEYDPLQRYGIVLTEASVAQKAMEMTGKASAQQLTENEKVAARQALIMEGLGDAEGHAAREADNFATKLRTLKARGLDLAARWAAKLLPTATRFANFLGRLMDALEKLSPRMQKLIAIGLAVAAAIGPVLIVLGAMLPALTLLLGPVGLVLAAVGLLGAAFATNFLGVRDAVMGVVDWVVAFANAMRAAFGEGTKVSDIVEFLPAPLQRLERGFLLIADAVGDLVSRFRNGGLSAVLAALPGELAQVREGIVGLLAGMGAIALDVAISVGSWIIERAPAVADAILDFIGAAGVALGSVALRVGGWLITDGANLAGAFGAWVARALNGVDYHNAGFVAGQGLRQALIAVVPGIFSGFREALETHWQTILKWFALWPVAIPLAVVGATRALVPKAAEFLGGFLEGLGLDWAGRVRPWLAEMPGRALLAVGVLTQALVVKGGELLQGLWDGARAKWGELQGWFNTRGEQAASSVGSLLETLVLHGNDLIQGLLTGAKAIWNNVALWLSTRGSSAFNHIGDLGSTLRSRGVELIDGMWTGMGDVWDRVTGWLGGLGGKIPGFVGSLGGVLVQAGKDAIQGLINGIESMIPGLEATVGFINGIINRIDRGNSPWPMMIEAGSDAIDGLVIGLHRRMPQLASAVGSVSGVFDATPSFGAVGSMVGAAGGWNSGTTYRDINITVSGAGEPQAVADRVFATFAREIELREGK